MWAWMLTFALSCPRSHRQLSFASPEYLSFSVVAIGGWSDGMGSLSDIYGRRYTPTAGMMILSGICAPCHCGQH